MDHDRTHNTKWLVAVISALGLVILCAFALTLFRPVTVAAAPKQPTTTEESTKEAEDVVANGVSFTVGILIGFIIACFFLSLLVNGIKYFGPETSREAKESLTRAAKGFGISLVLGYIIQACFLAFGYSAPLIGVIKL